MHVMMFSLESLNKLAGMNLTKLAGINRGAEDAAREALAARKAELKAKEEADTLHRQRVLPLEALVEQLKVRGSSGSRFVASRFGVIDLSLAQIAVDATFVCICLRVPMCIRAAFDLMQAVVLHLAVADGCHKHEQAASIQHQSTIAALQSELDDALNRCGAFYVASSRHHIIGVPIVGVASCPLLSHHRARPSSSGP